MTYKVIKNEPKIHKSTGGVNIVIDPSIEAEYTVMKNGKRFVNIPRYHDNPEAVANLICKLLNENRKYKLKEDL